MRRAVRPLKEEAVRKADELLRGQTGGRSLTMKPEDAELRRRWMDAYIDAAGQGSYVESKGQAGVKEITQKCLGAEKNWIELRYLYYDGTGVSGARYIIKSLDSGSVVAQGTLNYIGYGYCGLPIGADNISYDFDDDPSTVRYLSKPTPNAEQAKVQAGWLERIGDGIRDSGLWLWGSLQGDFNEDATLGQIAVNTAITMIPIVDQAGDVRDIAANLKFLLWDKRYEDKWVWIALALTLIGLIPIVGSAAKGVLKAVARGLKTGAKIPLGLLIDILNKFHKGNAVTWIRRLAADLPRHAVEMKRLFREILDKLQGNLRSLADRLPGPLRSEVQDALSSIDEVRKIADGKIDEAVKELQQGLEKSLDDGVDFERKGATKSMNTRQQTVADPPDAPLPAPTRVKPTGGGRSGKRTKVQGDAATRRSLMRENEAADTLASNGYTVHQNPPPRPDGTKPDYLIEGEYFDCYAPSKNKSLKGIWDEIDGKVPRQANRIVLNLDDWGGDIEQIKAYFNEYPVEGLDEILVVREGQVFPL